MNPIEDEAVIAALLLKYPGKIELVDTTGQLPLLKRRQGISHWRVMDKEGNWYNNHEEVPALLKEKIHKTCFPPENKADGDQTNNLNLSRCMRFLPHDQDTGGFFVAVIQKLQQHDNVEERATKKIEIQNNKNKGDAHELLSEEARRCWQVSKDFYGIKEEFNDDWLVARSIAKEKPKHVFLLSSNCVQLVIQNPRLRVVSCGFKGLLSVQGDGTEYRILQPSINLMIPYMTEKRIVNITEKDFLVLMTESDPFFSSFCPETQFRLLNLEWGSCVFALTRNQHDSGSNVSYYVGFRGTTSCKALLKNNEKTNILHSLKLDILPSTKIEVTPNEIVQTSSVHNNGNNEIDI
jgi:hypothetical protein